MVRTAIKIVLVILLLFVAGRLMRGQGAAEKLPSFDVISVKADAPETETRANSPLGPGDVYVKTGGHLAAQGFPLATYISFAFRLLGSELDAVAAQLRGGR
jgi:hypothetical protein